jgi:serine/threonine protein phosphatase PrpC
MMMMMMKNTALPASSSSSSTAVAGGNIPGTDPDRPQKVNQDAHFYLQLHHDKSRNDNSNVTTMTTILGVMDGHGSKGQHVTSFLQTRLPIRLRQYLARSHRNSSSSSSGSAEEDKEYRELLEQQKSDLINLGNADPSDFESSDPIAQALIDAFLAAHLDARRDESVPTGRSGTTCVVCVITVQEEENDGVMTMVHTGFVGDSAAILVQAGESNGAAIVALTSKTTVDGMVDERARINRSGGRVVNGNVFYGPVGIAMTRALGDAVMLRAGVLPIPMVTRHEVVRATHSPLYICAGTDGVFDVLSSNQIFQLIADGSDERSLHDAVALVCQSARDAWLADLPIEPKVDDITCVIAQIDFNRSE